MTSRLWIQCDNTVKELRNQYGCRALSALVQSGTFASSSMAHLRVGHTHEDIDALFSLITTALRTTPANDLQTPLDLQKMINTKLGPIFAAKGQAWGIELVDTAPCIFPKDQILSLHLVFFQYQRSSLNFFWGVAGGWGVNPLKPDLRSVNGRRSCLVKFRSKMLSGQGKLNMVLVVKIYGNRCLKRSPLWQELLFLIQVRDWRSGSVFLTFWGLVIMEVLRMMFFAWSRKQCPADLYHKTHYWCFRRTSFLQVKSFLLMPTVKGVHYALGAWMGRGGTSSRQSVVHWETISHTWSGQSDGTNSFFAILSHSQMFGEFLSYLSWGMCVLVNKTGTLFSWGEDHLRQSLTSCKWFFTGIRHTRVGVAKKDYVWFCLAASCCFVLSIQADSIWWFQSWIVHFHFIFRWLNFQQCWCGVEHLPLGDPMSEPSSGDGPVAKILAHFESVTWINVSFEICSWLGGFGTFMNLFVHFVFEISFTNK